MFTAFSKDPIWFLSEWLTLMKRALLFLEKLVIIYQWILRNISDLNLKQYR